VEFPIPENHVISVGFPFFDMERSKFGNEEKKDQIVFISQGTIGEKMSKFAVELKARQDFAMDLVYKLHPGEYARWKQDYPWLVGSGIKVVDDDSIPLYKLLMQSKILVGVYSTVVYEGLGLGLRTFLLKLPGVEIMNELIKSQALAVVSTTDGLMAKLKEPEPTGLRPEFFLKPNALQNICTALDNIISGARRSYLSP